MSTTSQTVENAKPSIGGIFKNGAIAAGIAAVVNVVLYWIGGALNAWPPEALTGMGVPVALPAVIGMTVIASITATIVYLVMSRILSRERANRWFIILAVLVLVMMFFTPFTITNVPTVQIVLLEIMHVVLGGALIYFLPRSV